MNQCGCVLTIFYLRKQVGWIWLISCSSPTSVLDHSHRHRNITKTVQIFKGKGKKMSLTPDLPLTPYFSAALYSKALFRIIDVPGLHLIISS